MVYDSSRDSILVARIPIAALFLEVLSLGCNFGDIVEVDGIGVHCISSSTISSSNGGFLVGYKNISLLPNGVYRDVLVDGSNRVGIIPFPCEVPCGVVFSRFNPLFQEMMRSSDHSMDPNDGEGVEEVPSPKKANIRGRKKKEFGALIEEDS